MRLVSTVSKGALLAGLAATSLGGASVVARADTQAIDVTTVGTTSTNGFNYYQGPGGYTFGFDFTVNSNIDVTQLGYYNAGLTGGPVPEDGYGTHLVTLMDVTTDTTLATTRVTAESPVTGDFNYAGIEPVRLNTTDTYEVAGTMSDQYYLVGLNQSAAPLAPQINYQFGPQDIFGETGAAGTYNDFGPNFQFASTCTENVPGRDVIALTGDVCTAAPGTYNPTTTTVTLPVTYDGFGFYAHGGTINSPGDITINTSDPNDSGGSYGIWADTTGSQVNLNGTSSITTTSDQSHGVYASGGGQITSTGALSITTSGQSAYGVYASGAGSSITAALAAITTTGDFATGAQADNGGSLALTGGSITTSGSGAYGLYATGANSTISAANVAVSTSGGGAYAVLADSGGAVTLNGGSLSTGGLNTDAVVVTEGTAQLTGTSITTTGAGGGGVYVTGSAAAFTGTGLTISVQGGNEAYGVFNAMSESYSQGGAVTLSNSTITTAGAYDYAVVNADGGSASIRGGSISTSGFQSDAVNGYDGSTTTLTGVQLMATGDASKGISVHGPATILTGSNLAISTFGTTDETSGNTADGVFNGSGGTTGTVGGGTVTLTDSSVSTFGANSVGVETADSGTTTFTGGSITTSGAGSVGVLSSSGASTTIGFDEGGIGTVITTSGAGAIGAYASGTGSSINATGASISTSAALTPAVQADQGGAVTLTGGTVSTSGNGSWGLYTNGAGSTLSATGTTVSTTGGVDPSGNVSLGAYAQQGSSMTLTDTTIVTSGAAAHGAEAGNASTIALSGGSVTTSGPNAYGLFSTDTNSSITTNGVAIATTGLESDGVFAYNGASATLQGGSVTTAGLGAAGLFASGAGAKLSATGVTVSTTGGLDPATGNQSQGVTAVNSATVTLTNDAITTSGEQGHGVLAATGATVAISGGSVAVSGVDADGLLAAGAGSVITTSGGLVVTSTATMSAHTIEGARADAGGVLNLAGTTISTFGTSVSGVGVETGATANLNGVTVTTTGDAAHAITSTGAGSTVSLAGTNNLTTTGNGAIGIFAGSGGGVTQTGAVSIATAGTNALVNGLSSFGVNADGVGSSITLDSATITTAGQGAVGLMASDFNESGTGGVITVNGALSVATQSTFAYDAFASGPGAQIALNGATNLSVGAGSFGLYATDGGVITTSGALSITAASAGFGGGVEADTGSSITLGGTSAINLTSTNLVGVFAAGGTIASTAGLTVNAGANAGIVAQDGGVVNLNGSTTISSTANGLVVFGASDGGPAGSISSSGNLSLTTTANTGAALVLNGDGATFSGTGGGTINSAGKAIEFLNGADQIATFDNYTINSVSGDLVFADPSSSTINFNNTTANAGNGNLIDATNQSAITLNASASTLTGAIATDATSTTNVNLSNTTTWNLTGNSNVSNLRVNNSAIVFAPSTSGGFSTLTVGSYTGTGASITLNALLSGANPGADKLVINGGQATGTTTINIKSLGTIGAPTTGLGVPIVTTANGGSIAPGAFALASPLVVGGFKYSLEAEDGGEYLVSQAGLTSAQANSSLASLAQSKESQTITNRILGSILTGATEQMNCSSCSSGFASFGSFAVGVHGRWTLSPNVELLAGVSYDSYSAKGVSVNNSMDVAAALRYDAVQLGRYRPFFEAGLGASPYADVIFHRSYSTTSGGGSGGGSTLSQAVAVFGRTGYIFRLSRIDEAAVYTDITRSWQHTDGYQEASAVGNPFGALVAPSLDTLNIWKIGGQYTHLFGEHIEANISAGYALAFGADYGATADISGFGAAAGTAPSTFGWAELGGRLSYRLSQKLTADAFVLGTVGAEPAGSQIHGGVALRLDF